MAQLYLLSILANIIAGLMLSSDYLGRKMTFLEGFKKLYASRSLKISLGSATAVIGVLKLIFKSPGETVPVAGDLLPALFGVGLGLLLLGEAYRQRGIEQRTQETNTTKEQKDLTILSYNTPLGIAGIVVSLIHFAIPGVLIF